MAALWSRETRLYEQRVDQCLTTNQNVKVRNSKVEDLERAILMLPRGWIKHTFEKIKRYIELGRVL